MSSANISNFACANTAWQISAAAKRLHELLARAQNGEIDYTTAKAEVANLVTAIGNLNTTLGTDYTALP